MENKVIQPGLLSSKLADLNILGYAVLEDIIETSLIETLRLEVLEAQKKIFDNAEKIRSVLAKDSLITDEELMRRDDVQLRSSGRVGYVSKLPSDLIYLPRFSVSLAHATFLSTVEECFSTEVRLCQIHPKVIPRSETGTIKRHIDLLGIGKMYSSGSPLARDWHRDWPHDLTGYGGGNPGENIGFVRADSPDAVLCLTAVHYLRDSEQDSGATWVIPGSHKWYDDPRDANSDTCLSAPMPGEIQVPVRGGGATDGF